MECKNCKRLVTKNHKFCSKECYWKSLEGIKGENAPNWRKMVGKSQVHKWLDVHYGKLKVCENSKCKRLSEWFDWALIHGKEYERNKSNFIRLCRKCHREYDMTFEKRNKAIKNLAWSGGKSATKLTEAKVWEIRDMLAGFKAKQVADWFQIPISTIKDIYYKRTWKHLK